MTDVPAGAAIVERLGWEDREECAEHPAGHVFTATLIFPNGPPDLSAMIVWGKVPVNLVIARGESLTAPDTAGE